MSGWSDGQVREFARRLATSDRGRAWWAFVPDVREALIDQLVLEIVLSQDRGEVQVSDVRSLRRRLALRLQRRHGLRNQHGDAEDDAGLGQDRVG